MQKEFLTFCHICPGHCSRKITVEDGKIVAVDLETTSGLRTEFCPYAKARYIPEICHHPDRLKYPLKRVGPKGSGKWERISWDEALDMMTEKLAEYKEKFGPESVAFCLGEPKGMEFAFAQRFATVFGTPNVVTPGNYCGVPRGAGNNYTVGRIIAADEGCSASALVILWGSNVIHTSGGISRETLRTALQSGAKLWVIDPKKIDIAKRADRWISLRPQSDGSLAMGMLKVIIEEKLYDEDFVAKWTVGFDRLQEHIKSFSLEDVEKVTWVPRETVIEMARQYAKLKPARIIPGNGLEKNINAFQIIRTITIMSAITGNINVPGGDIFLTPGPFTRPGRFFLMSKYPRTEKEAIGGEFKIAIQSAYILPQLLVRAILEEKPYPVKAAICILTDPLMSFPDSELTCEAFKKLDLLIVSELFMTPTAAVADLVLPAAWGAEHDTLGYWPVRHEELRAYPKIVDPPGEAWADTKWLNELAKKLALPDFWENEEEALNYMLEPSGFSWQDFKEKRIIAPTRHYAKPEEGIFKTKSGKAEIYSERLQKLGYSPMPLFEELSRFRQQPSEEYPLLLFNGKEEAYMLTGFKNIASAREARPVPVVELNPETAEKAGLREGEWVYIETSKGRIKQKLALDPDLHPGLVFAAFGWWFPEDPEDLYQFRKSNINVLIDGAPPYDPVTGSVEMGGIPCKVYEVERN